MQKEFSQNDKNIAAYALNTFKPEDNILKEVRDRAKKLEIPAIHVNDMDGKHLEVLIAMANAEKIIEVGTLAGYSAICIARGMQNKGILHTIEIEQKHYDAAKTSFKNANISHLIKQHLGSALNILKSLEQEGSFDAIFIDADKVSYPDYLTWAEKNIRIGGIIIADNTFAWGHINDSHFETLELEKQVKGIREFNQRIANNSNFKATILPTGEGLTVAVRIS
ncbi:O-methyltransferase [Fluviispira multicolorata]|uniref:O-methyltransferase n=1 Tax=Fluviispira multicolorata TaxID=2654512 RepID=A0A833JCW7_9BACT|nr:O-methyltransferase [Fluviispira multicolorata]KAB8030807.1 O-methyltransferase [Fluviispira multicolorata]